MWWIKLLWDPVPGRGRGECWSSHWWCDAQSADAHLMDCYGALWTVKREAMWNHSWSSNCLAFLLLRVTDKMKKHPGLMSSAGGWNVGKCWLFEHTTQPWNATCFFYEVLGLFWFSLFAAFHCIACCDIVATCVRICEFFGHAWSDQAQSIGLSRRIREFRWSRSAVCAAPHNSWQNTGCGEMITAYNDFLP